MAKAKRENIAWDSCIVIDSLDRPDDRIAPIDEILSRCENGSIVIWASTLAFAETARLKRPETEEQEAQIEGFFNRHYVQTIAISKEISRIARHIRANNPIDLWDAFHVATAVQHNCSSLITIDGIGPDKKRPLLELDGKIHVRDGRTLRVITPTEFVAEVVPLFAKGMTEYDEKVEKRRKRSAGAES